MSQRTITRDEAEQLAESAFVKTVRFYDQVPSTNDVALSETVRADELPTLFITADQTAGRGRGPNRWISSQGALTFSLAVSPATLRADAACWPQLSLWTALGIRDAIANLVPRADVQVKWPNDVFLQKKKVCGILIETRITPSGDRLLIIGIGINVHNEFAGPNVAETVNAVAMGQHQSEISVAQTAQSALTHIDDAWDLFASRHSLRDHWPEHCLLTGRLVRWQKSTESVEGICRSISDDGALLLQNPESGSISKCFGGTIDFEV